MAEFDLCNSWNSIVIKDRIKQYSLVLFSESRTKRFDAYIYVMLSKSSKDLQMRNHASVL